MPGRLFAFPGACLLFLSLAGCSGGSGSDCPDCDDGVDCTVDACLEATGQCQHTPDDARCTAGQACDPVQGCTLVAECWVDVDCDDQDGCTADTCVDGICQHQDACACAADADCDDADACTADACVAGQCTHQNTCACQQDPDCNDGNPCTDDACDQGQCSYADNTAACDDGQVCTEDDTCAAGACHGQAVDCDDQNPCTDDLCDAVDGCVNTTNAGTCDDGDACTGPDACAGGQCTAGAESCCGDQIDNDGDGLTDCADGDCDGQAGCGDCQPVPAPDPVPMAPLPGEAAPGRTESTSVNGFSDDYVYNSAETLKVGTRRNWGGTIIFFGMTNGFPGVNTTNTIDANDTGREVQVAFYDPDRQMQNCAWDASCANDPTDCPNSITYLGWNPVQGGNRCNRGSGVEGVTAAAGVQTVTTNPLFWNPNWDRQDCSDAACNDPDMRERRSDVRVVQRLRFVRTHVVELEYTVINLSDLDHRAGGQEMPTVYTANSNGGTPDLWRLMDSNGNQVTIDQPANDGFFYKNFTTPGGWACMQDDALGYGVGLYTENRLTQMQGWQNRDLPFNNFRPVFSFGIPALGTVMARAYLLIGNFDTIAGEAGWLDTHLAPFGWLDEPVADAAVSGTITVRGWTLDNKGVAGVDVLVDGANPTPLAVGGSRPDVCLVWPAYPGCPNVGYSGSLDTSGLSECQHLLEIRATDTDGNQRVIARRRISVSH